MSLAQVMHGKVPAPDLGDTELPRTIAQNLLAALSNHNTSGATVSAAAVAPYTPINAAAITRKSSGIFLVFATCTISINGGTMADADAVVYSGMRGPLLTPTLIGPTTKTTGAVSATTGAAAGYTVTADMNLMFIDTPGIAMGASVIYGLRVVGVDGTTHTSGVVATTDGQIVVIELPG